jgi:hypothetical protein
MVMYCGLCQSKGPAKEESVLSIILDFLLKSISSPSMVLGDFNEILSISEKIRTCASKCKNVS